MAGVNIYHSRRGMFHKCKYWIRDESGIGNSEEYAYQNEPTGIFYAKEMNAENVAYNTLFDSFMADEHTILIMSSDNLDGMRENCIVLFEGDIWRVENVQKTIIRKENQFRRGLTYHWYMQLRR